ncbi:cytochrome P450 2J2-like [Ambystoma mexicanum]|uniref:cytochrome P450 2J2-like n=1 Tax=Ambystoma mexicanum TaxID=8296 RepID=UPI0037E7AFA9
MLAITEILVFLIAAAFVAQFIRLQHAAKRLPPGRTPVPLLGNLWTLKFTFHHETFMQLAKTYGNIITVWAGHTPLVVVNGYEAVKDALIYHSEETSGRPLTPALRAYAKEKGVSLSTGETWKQQRRFLVTALRHLGIKTRILDCRIQQEAQDMVEAFTATEGRAIHSYPIMVTAVANVISSMVFGHRFSINDDSLRKIMEATGSITQFVGSYRGQLYNIFPQLMKHLPGFYQTLFENIDFLNNYVKQEIRAHCDTVADEPQDLIDLYLAQISKNKSDPDSGFDEANMIQIVIDAFLAGTETTACILEWTLLYMVLHPEIQGMAQQELDAVLDTSHIVQYEDYERLPYTNAVIHEIQRHSSVLPMGAPRSCLMDTVIQGFPIRKGTTILTNLTSVLYDPEHWEAPQEFNPSHFLDKKGKFVKNEAFIPFSAGQRMCAAEQMAKKELFIFISNLLREFTFHLPAGVQEATLDCTYGISLRPHPYKICAARRKAEPQQ